MLFLILRLLPYAVPILFFFCVKSVFYFTDEWQWFLAAILILPLLYFALLKYKNREKTVVWLCAFALIFAVAGFMYCLILENPSVINAYLIIWSLIYGLYLEAVFHDFYETAKTYVLNLNNITLYGSILIVFFLTATLVNFNIFLNFHWLLLLLFAAAAYFFCSYLALFRHNIPASQALLYSGLTDLLLIEILGGLLLLPCSFYVIAIIITLCYYLLMQIILLSAGGKMNRKILLELLAFCGAILIVITVTAAWL